MRQWTGMGELSTDKESFRIASDRCLVAGNSRVFVIWDFFLIVAEAISFHENHVNTMFAEGLGACVAMAFNTLRPRRNGHHFADDIFKRIFFNENIWILIQISLKSVPKDPINNIPSLVQIMAWRRPGDKLLSEPMMVILLTHICVTRPHWVKGHVIDYIW